MREGEGAGLKLRGCTQEKYKVEYQVENIGM